MTTNGHAHELCMKYENDLLKVNCTLCGNEFRRSGYAIYIDGTANDVCFVCAWGYAPELVKLAELTDQIFDFAQNHYDPPGWVGAEIGRRENNPETLKTAVKAGLAQLDDAFDSFRSSKSQIDHPLHYMAAEAATKALDTGDLQELKSAKAAMEQINIDTSPCDAIDPGDRIPF